MASTLRIIVTNNTPSRQDFHFFQQPAVFTGEGQVFCNSLFSEPLQPYRPSGANLTLQMRQQPFAGIQRAKTRPQIGLPSGDASFNRPIDPAPHIGEANDWTTASVDPLGLSRPTAAADLRPGNFRMTMPMYRQTDLYNVGSAVEVHGFPVLSSFVVAQPDTTVDCSPIARFYVRTGRHTAGSVVDFTTASIHAAICDFTDGGTVVNVTLNPDGTWIIQRN